MDKFSYLKKVPLFSDLNNSELKLIQRICKIKRFSAGETIFDEHTSGNCLYVVISGRVKIFRCTGKKKKTLAYLEKGEFFGEMSLLDMEPRSASSDALAECELLVIKKDDFKKLLAKYPHISFQVMKTLSRRLRQADDEIESLSYENVFGRIAGTLLELSSKYGEETSSGTRIKMSLNHQDLAELTGTAREMVSRTLNRLKRLNYITYASGHIVITDTAKLKNFVY